MNIFNHTHCRAFVTLPFFLTLLETVTRGNSVLPQKRVPSTLAEI